MSSIYRYDAEVEKASGEAYADRASQLVIEDSTSEQATISPNELRVRQANYYGRRGTIWIADATIITSSH